MNETYDVNLSVTRWDGVNETAEMLPNIYQAFARLCSWVQEHGKPYKRYTGRITDDRGTRTVSLTPSQAGKLLQSPNQWFRQMPAVGSTKIIGRSS